MQCVITTSNGENYSEVNDVFFFQDEYKTLCMHKEAGTLESTNSAINIILVFLSLPELTDVCRYCVHHMTCRTSDADLITSINMF